MPSQRDLDNLMFDSACYKEILEKDSISHPLADALPPTMLRIGFQGVIFAFSGLHLRIG